MKLGLCVVAVLAALVGVTAARTVSENNQTVTVDCAKDGNFAVDGNSNTIKLVGACTRVMVNGNRNTIDVAATDRLAINGNDNTVNAAKAGTVSVPGDRNTVNIQAPPASLSNAGNHNTVTVPKP